MVQPLSIGKGYERIGNPRLPLAVRKLSTPTPGTFDVFSQFIGVCGKHLREIGRGRRRLLRPRTSCEHSQGFNYGLCG
jgi:hypothetical protein